MGIVRTNLVGARIARPSERSAPRQRSARSARCRLRRRGTVKTVPYNVLRELFAPTAKTGNALHQGSGRWESFDPLTRLRRDAPCSCGATATEGEPIRAPFYPRPTRICRAFIKVLEVQKLLSRSFWWGAGVKPLLNSPAKRGYGRAARRRFRNRGARRRPASAFPARG